MLLFLIVGLAYSTPVPDPKPVKSSQTPASTEKLTPLVAAPLPALAAIPQVAVPLAAFPPLAYAFVAPFKIATIPSTYTVEQHGYTISY
ncbi:hypothetical protein TSAR_009500 [Trichomalopsis sarcophagae]|uniref:Uncharacterized protein n=1 Tax=Trichomalopsis sarcophagae TaxID=543379 RepID=A0A232ETR1_9HYME|nr:hypothetical protein TSAR_009500 [Trichomalopsis sarcophagae]